MTEQKFSIGDKVFVNDIYKRSIPTWRGTVHRFNGGSGTVLVRCDDPEFVASHSGYFHYADGRLPERNGRSVSKLSLCLIIHKEIPYDPKQMADEDDDI